MTFPRHTPWMRPTPRWAAIDLARPACWTMAQGPDGLVVDLRRTTQAR